MLKDKSVKEKLADFTKYSRIIKNSGACICVFLDGDAGYDKTKDSMAIGACIQNMLLTAEETGLAACWLGEILNRKDEVNECLSIPGKYELMAVIAIGYGDENPSSDRKPLTDLII